MSVHESTEAAPRYDHKFLMETLTLAFQQFALIANHIGDAEVEQARKTLETADAIGFVVDPTKYRDALFSGSLERQKKLVALFVRTKAELKAIFPEGWTA